MHAFVYILPLCADNNSLFLSLSAKKEEEDLEDKKSIKKRIKELKVLDPKIAQNLCKYLFPLSVRMELYTSMSLDVRICRTFPFHFVAHYSISVTTYNLYLCILQRDIKDRNPLHVLETILVKTRLHLV